jgi:succinyl-CoA synthetase beta subunit
LAGLGRAVRELARLATPTPLPPRARADLAGGLRDILQTARPGVLTEHESKAILAAAGIRVRPGVLLRSPDEVGAAAHLEFPLAVKIQSPDIAHKTEAGGVRLNVRDEASLRAACADVMAAATAYAPRAEIHGVLIEPMAPPGIEMIVGVVRDPVFGPVLMVGAGGVATELFHDVTYRLAPVDTDGARAMLDELRIKKLLDGFRGAPGGDIAALAELIARVSELASACRDRVREVEINPVIVHPPGGGCSIADALIALEPQPASSGA